MCGIAGVFSVERPIDAAMVEAVLRMLDRQVHRGPDDWGILIPEGSKHDAGICALLEPRGWEHVRTYPGAAAAPAAVLGSRRLSILDLSSAGRMPMTSRDGRVAVTYNGEIYNFRELRAELTGLGHTFKSSTDTEILLHGYQQWGDALPSRLRGMCAFAVLDSRRNGEPKLFLVRDRFGIKPLYWARQEGVLQFASEVRAILAAGLVRDEAEPRGLHGFLMYGSVPTPWTTVRGVLALPAAESLSIDQSSYSYPKPQRYWSLPSATTAAPADAAAQTRDLMVSAVREQMVSDVPIGVFLSGGMDSSAITALAARELDRPLTTLCVTFDEAGFSEARYARAVADRFRTNHIEVPVRASDFVDELPHFFDSLDQPTADGINSYFVAKAAKAAGLTVVLSGLGGDELFWGYPGFRSYPRLRAAMRVPMAGTLAIWLGRVLSTVGFSKFEKLEFLAQHPVLGPYLTIRGLFPPRRAGQLLNSGQLPVWCPGDITERGLTSQFGRLEVGCYLQNQLLRDTDVFAMRHSVEVRVPFLDHRLAEWISHLSPSLLKSTHRAKPLLAAAMGVDYLDEVVNRPKMGFTFPMGRWIQNAWSDINACGGTTSSLISDSQLEAVAADHGQDRLHWSRPWALAVLRAAEKRKRRTRSSGVIAAETHSSRAPPGLRFDWGNPYLQPGFTAGDYAGISESGGSRCQRQRRAGRTGGRSDRLHPFQRRGSTGDDVLSRETVDERGEGGISCPPRRHRQWSHQCSAVHERRERDIRRAQHAHRARHRSMGATAPVAGVGSAFHSRTRRESLHRRSHAWMGCKGRSHLHPSEYGRWRRVQARSAQGESARSHSSDRSPAGVHRALQGNRQSHRSAARRVGAAPASLRRCRYR